MSEAARNFWVGMFVLASLVVLTTLMVWFGEAPDWLMSSEWELRVTGVQELSGISEGSEVRLNGVQIGRVKSIDFVAPNKPGRGVKILVGVKQRYSVPTGSTAYVYGATLGFGIGNIDIVPKPGAPPLPKDDAEVHGIMRSRLSEVISRDAISTFEQTVESIGELARAASPVADNLAELLEKRSLADVDAEGGAMANVSTVVVRLDRFLSNLNAVLGDENVQDEVKAAVRDLKDATESLKATLTLWHDESRKLADNVNSGIDGAKEDLERTFVQLNRVLESLDAATTGLALAMRHVEEGDGTVGLLVNDERLYEAAVLAVQRFTAVMANLEVITGKIKEDGYITVGQAPTGLLRKSFPVGVKAAGSE